MTLGDVSKRMTTSVITVLILATSACQSEHLKEQQMPRHYLLSDGNTKLLLFVHGLGGDGLERWRGHERGFLELIRDDPELTNQYDLAFFRYPTSGFAIPWVMPGPRIGELAAALKTERDQR